MEGWGTPEGVRSQTPKSVWGETPKGVWVFLVLVLGQGPRGGRGQNKRNFYLVTDFQE